MTSSFADFPSEPGAPLDQSGISAGALAATGGEQSVATTSTILGICSMKWDMSFTSRATLPRRDCLR